MPEDSFVPTRAPLPRDMVAQALGRIQVLRAGEMIDRSGIDCIIVHAVQLKNLEALLTAALTKSTDPKVAEA